MRGHVLVLVCPREPRMKDGTARSPQHHLAKYELFRSVKHEKS